MQTETLSNQPPPQELEQMLHVARKFDVAGRDERNRALGRAGEERVVAHERSALKVAGRDDLARKVRWVAICCQVDECASPHCRRSFNRNPDVHGSPPLKEPTLARARETTNTPCFVHSLTAIAAVCTKMTTHGKFWRASKSNEFLDDFSEGLQADKNDHFSWFALPQPGYKLQRTLAVFLHICRAQIAGCCK
jgi:hypothetical protein